MNEQDEAKRESRADQAPHRYDAQLANQIEPYWQDWWAKSGAFETPNPAGELAGDPARTQGRAKLYVLDMFPYPSGAGLHVGHPLGYIGTDVWARYKRMSGYNVLHPFGYDAFGLPAEQYAIETGTHPRVTTEANIANMRRQLRRLGLAHDPRREFATTDTGYYGWTQWIFLQLFDAWFDPEQRKARPIAVLEQELAGGARAPAGEGNPDGLPWARLTAAQRRRVVDAHRLAYIAEAPVNWCPGLGTVLANEEVTSDGRSAIGNYPVFRRPMRQWMLRITAYAERLLEDLDLLDWPESIKTSQRNWIGRSEGANVRFPIVGSGEGGAADVTVFTTRPDTLFGATFMVLAPEHPLVDALVADAWPEGCPAAWRGGSPEHAATPCAAVGEYRRRASRVTERERLAGADAKTGVFTGGYVVNPTTGRQLPVFVADYVLMGYGTGAIMAVPAHDERDFEFAHRLGLPIEPVIAPPQAWLDGHNLPGEAELDVWAWPEPYVGEGTSINSANDGVSLDALGTVEAKRAIVAWLERVGAGRGVISHRLRDWLFSRQRYWGEPFPIVYDADGLPRALPAELLPVELPEMTDFRPHPDLEERSEPEPPLARVTGWTEVTLDLGDGPRTYRRELNVMPQWAGSCWYYLRYLDPTNDRALVDPEIERYWSGEGAVAPVDLYVGGVEHAVLHLLYARFWHKVLYDLDAVRTPEPFGRLYNQGYILAAAYTDERGLYVPADEVREQPDGSFAYQGRPVVRLFGKMGKSLKNSITPDEICAEYGADTLRLYEMSMGPFDMDRPWSTEGLAGSYRFLQRVWRNLVDEETGELRVADTPADPHLERALHRTIDVVARDIEGLRFNTAIARLMELNNALVAAVRATGSCPRAVAEPLVLMLAPFAPHIGEELWHRLGHADTVADVPFPTADPELLRVEEVTLPVGVDGKVRFRVTAAADAGEDALRALVLDRPELQRYLHDRDVDRVIVVPGRIVNVTTRAR
jgi:leucyl-tRNA synthetase